MINKHKAWNFWETESSLKFVRKLWKLSKLWGYWDRNRLPPNFWQFLKHRFFFQFSYLPKTTSRSRREGYTRRPANCEVFLPPKLNQMSVEKAKCIFHFHFLRFFWLFFQIKLNFVLKKNPSKVATISYWKTHKVWLDRHFFWEIRLY